MYVSLWVVVVNCKGSVDNNGRERDVPVRHDVVVVIWVVVGSLEAPGRDGCAPGHVSGSAGDQSSTMGDRSVGNIMPLPGASGDRTDPNHPWCTS